MSRFFDRNYELTVTAVNGEVLTYKPPMQVKFAIDHTPQNANATARITIYGISASARDLIQKYDEKQKHYGSIVLKAGYGEDIGTLFGGKINNIEVMKEGVNTCLRLYCWTVGLEWNTSINKTWGANTPAIDVLRDIASAFGTGVEVVGDFSDLPRNPRPYPSGGRLCRDLLNEMVIPWRYRWRLTPSRTVIVRDGAARDWATHEISYKNGMEGVPRWYLSTMELDVRLNYKIQPDDVIKVTSNFWTINYSGMYQTDLQGLSEIQRQQRTGNFNVLSTYHEGDFWGNTWKTTLINQWRSA